MEKDSLETKIHEDKKCETVRISARWTLENWKRFHKLFVKSRECFSVKVPLVGLCQFFVTERIERSYNRDNFFQEYALQVKIIRETNNKDPIIIQFLGAASHLPNLPDTETSFNLRESFHLYEPKTTSECFDIFQGFLKGPLGRSATRNQTQKAESKKTCGMIVDDTMFIHLIVVASKRDTNSHKPEAIELRVLQPYAQRMYCEASFSVFHDLCLIAADGIELYAHKSILAARYKRVGSLVELCTLNSETRDLVVSDLNSHILKLILEFVYTGQILIPHLQNASKTCQLSELLQAARLYTMTDLMTYLSGRMLTLCSADNVVYLYGLCKEYSLQQGQEQIHQYFQDFRNVHKVMYALCVTGKPSLGGSTAVLHVAAEKDTSRIEKVSKMNPISMTAADSWILSLQQGETNSLDLKLGGNLVTFGFSVNSECLAVKIIQCSETFMDSHMLVDITADIEIVYNDEPPGHLRSSSQITFSKNDQYSTPATSVELSRRLLPFGFSCVDQMILHVDVECLLNRDMYLLPKEDTHLKIVVLKLKDGHNLPVEKIKLASNPVFRAMLFGSMKESGQTFVSIPDLNVATMLVIVEYIYSGIVEDLWKSNVEEVLEGSTRYMLDGLISHVDKNIYQTCTPESALELYKLAWFYDLTTAQDDIITYVREHAAAVLEALVSGKGLSG